MRMVNVIEAIDGQRCRSEAECLDYERSLFQAAYERLYRHFALMFSIPPTTGPDRVKIIITKINELILVHFPEGTCFNSTFKEDCELFSNKYPVYLTQGGSPIETKS